GHPAGWARLRGVSAGAPQIRITRGLHMVMGVRPGRGGKEPPALRGAKVLVTGGAGFVGSHTTDALLRAGARVAVVDNLSTGRRQNLNPDATFYEVNIADESFGEILTRERPDLIYHFAFYV